LFNGVNTKKCLHHSVLLEVGNGQSRTTLHGYTGFLPWRDFLQLKIYMRNVSPLISLYGLHRLIMDEHLHTWIKPPFHRARLIWFNHCCNCIRTPCLMKCRYTVGYLWTILRTSRSFILQLPNLPQDDETHLHVIIENYNLRSMCTK